MPRAKFEYCPIREIRVALEERLDLPPFESVRLDAEEAPAAFWARVEEAGLLDKALALFDRLQAERSAQARVPMETKGQFDERIEREGRRAEVDRVREELVASGLNMREVQRELVARFQPLDGSKTRAWETPDPWLGGRLFLSKETQARLLQASGAPYRPKDGTDEAKRRLAWAERRRDERLELEAARRRARAQKEAPAKIKAGPQKVKPSRQAESIYCDECTQRHGLHFRHCPRFVEGKTSFPCDDCYGPVTPKSATYDKSARRHWCDNCYAIARRNGLA